MNNNLIVIISSPSGGGKDAVIRALLKTFPNSAKLITTTTRAPRPKEENGRDYYFISEQEFKNKIQAGEFVEHNLYSGHYYGTEKDKLKELLQKYQIIFTNIDVHGKQNFDQAGIEHLSIFLLPENEEVLKTRIAKRGGTELSDLNRRIEIAKNEINLAKNYDFQIVNKEGELEETIEQVEKIIAEAIDKKG